MPTKFHPNPFNGSGEEVENLKSLRQTDCYDNSSLEPLAQVFVDGTRLNIGNWKSKGSARTLFEGVCIFEYSKINLGKDYVTEISVAYSNNGQLYSKIQTHILYDSACQTTDTSNGMKTNSNKYMFTAQEPYTTGGPPATTETPIPRTPAVFDTHISLDKPFDPQLSYINSTAYSQFKTEIESEVDHLYRSSELKNVFDRNELYGVRNGSTKCDLYIYVNTTKFQRDNTSGQIETVDVDGKLVAETAITQIMKAKQLSDSDHIKLLVQSDTSSITSSKILGTTTQMMTTEVEETTTHDETSDGTTTQETTTDSISTLEATAPETTQQKTTIAETSIQGTTTEASSLIENDFISELFTDKALYIGAAAGVVILIIPIIVIVIVVKLKNNAKMKTQDSGSNKTGDSVSSGSNGSTYEDADSMKGFMQNPNMFRQNYRIPRASLSTSSKTGPYNYIY
ncbi:hypothetical protein FSP39_008217 [Pinctada imbricata]|uniref:SEA domain-containing protein n=1 Tax=Pinctada imbricata TaxID=66713 RepID=A0AA88Y397_PINIB|nr:hypothetical protein FSP39_008217 [Pinctada imbricata]